MQSSTDLCVTVQLYTQVSACCWLGRLVYGWRQNNNNKATRQDLAELEASLAPAEVEVGAVAKTEKKNNFPKSGGKLVTEIFPQLSRISPVLGEIGRQFDYFLYLYNYKCTNAEKWYIYKLLWHSAMPVIYYSHLATHLHSKIKKRKKSISPDLGDFPRFEKWDFPRSGEIPHSSVQPDC